MSRLVYSGDLNKNFGEFFPTPYIDLVILRSVTNSTTGESMRGAFAMELRSSLLFTVPEFDPNVPNNDINFVKDIVNRLQFYYIITKSTAEGTALFDRLESHRVDFGFDYEIGSSSILYSITDGITSPKKQHSEQMEKYKDATGIDFTAADDAVDELSLLLYDSSILVELLKDPPPTSYQNIGAHTTAFDPEEPNKGISYDIIHISKEDILTAIESGQYTTFYSKSGQKILKVQTVQNHQTVVKVPEQIPLTAEERARYLAPDLGYPGTPPRPELKYRYAESYNANVNVLAFSSILTPEQLRSSDIKTNAALSMAFGDVAYEHVLVDGAIADSQIEYSYFDANNEIYGQTPLRGLDGKYYKADSTNHKAIVSEFKQLIDSYHKLIPSFKRLGVKVVSAGSAKPLNDSESADPLLEASLESVSYILAKFAKSANLVPRLASARRTILDRSSGTKTGAFYSDSGELLGRANSIVTSGTPLTKKLTINTKIVDERKYRDAGYELPNPQPLRGDQLLQNFRLGRNIIWTNQPSYRVTLADYLKDEPFIPSAGADFGPGTPGPRELEDKYSRTTGNRNTGGEGNINYSFEIDEDGHLIIHMDSLLGRKTIAVDDPAYAGLFQTNYFAKEEYNISFGYFLYDWQQHIVNNSFLATMVNVRSFQQHFGNELLQRYFVPKKAVLKKYMPVTITSEADRLLSSMPRNPILTYTREMTATPGWDPATVYDPDLSTSTVDRYTGPGPNSLGKEINLAAYPEKVTTKRSQLLQHYLTERNVGFLGDAESASNNQGKLMAFEFQNIDQHATLGEYMLPVVDRYDYEIHVQDGTKQVMVDLVNHYFYLGEALRAYLLDASQECSYNNIDGVFNDFFAEAMEALYTPAPGTEPWLMAAVAYVKNLDFMTNKWGGDPAQLLIEARNIAQKISPRSGTLEQLRSFYYNYIDFYETYYSESSTLGKYMSEPRGGPPGPTSFATPYIQTLTLEASWSDESYSNQTEADRDAFISVINAEQKRYADASAYAEEALASYKGQIAADIKALFDERAVVYAEKIDYEAARISWGGGCQYVWWWDAWNGRADFSHVGADVIDLFGDGTGWIDADEFSDINPNGIANDQYGYVWIDPYYEDDVVEWYDVEKYGEPTYFAGYRRDKEGLNCRYQKRNYKYRPGDQRRDKKGSDKGERRYGGFAGSPSGDRSKLFTQRDDMHGGDLKAKLESTYPPDGGYEVHIPGFDSIRHWRTYQQYLNDASGLGLGAGPEGQQVSSGEYTTSQQHESAMDQANTGFDERSDEQTSNIGEDHVGRKM